MKLYKNPDKKQWATLATRPTLDNSNLYSTVGQIIEQVRLEGDAALRYFSQKFDGCKLTDLEVSEKELQEAEELVSDALKEALQVAKANITRFHESQKEFFEEVETTPGIHCWRKSVGIERVGLYIPGGTAPLFSTVLMLAIPAQIAGCQEVILCSPPNSEGALHPAILYAARLCGVQRIFKVGGAQAIAAMGLGTETVPMVYKIFGPGNQYVTAAKTLLAQNGTAIDMPAGPSELLVIADESANPEFVASDLLSQAEHGVDSQVILLSDSEKVLTQTKEALERQLEQLPRAEMTAKALIHSRAICFENLEQAMSFSNYYAPEHLILATAQARAYAEQVRQAGSVFIGHYTPESLGDYASGTNHTLPTNGFARAYSGVSLDSFIKKITFQEAKPEGLLQIGKTVEIMATAECLDAHKNAVTIRLNTLTQNSK
ncbi:MAG: histidinol dehydrogenase [Bernardetiaceae bacterium]|nr:histidinol dehydrogenase [Bernardetiaceae bacterium]